MNRYCQRVIAEILKRDVTDSIRVYNDNNKYGIQIELKRSSLNNRKPKIESLGVEIKVGDGIFSTVAVEPNTVIGYYGGFDCVTVDSNRCEIYQLEDIHPEIFSLLLQSRVLYKNGHEKNVYCSGYGHWSSKIQHQFSSHANVKFHDNGKGNIELIATKFIKPGGELFVDYGIDYWVYKVFNKDPEELNVTDAAFYRNKVRDYVINIESDVESSDHGSVTGFRRLVDDNGSATTTWSLIDSQNSNTKWYFLNRISR